MANRSPTDSELAAVEERAERLLHATDPEASGVARSATSLVAEVRRLRSALRVIGAEIRRIPLELYNSDPTVNRIVDNISALATRADP